jgi:hypothetical protein
VALDLAVPLPRPRYRASAEFTRQKEIVLAGLLGAAHDEEIPHAYRK